MTTSREHTVKLVRDLMHIGVRTCPANTSLIDAVCILVRENLDSLIVLDENGNAVGLFGLREVMNAFGRYGADVRDCRNLTVAKVMQPEIPEIPPDIPAMAAAQLMLDQNIREMYLMHYDGGFKWPSAVFRFADVLSYLANQS